MPDSKKMSRRDWFRLRAPAPSKTPTAPNRETTAIGEEAIGLAAIEHPPNYDGMDLSELPPMREAVLTRPQVLELFDDLAAVATDILLMERSRSRSRAT